MLSTVRREGYRKRGRKEGDREREREGETTTIIYPPWRRTVAHLSSC